MLKSKSSSSRGIRPLPPIPADTLREQTTDSPSHVLRETALLRRQSRVSFATLSSIDTQLPSYSSNLDVSSLNPETGSIILPRDAEGDSGIHGPPQYTFGLSLSPVRRVALPSPQTPTNVTPDGDNSPSSSSSGSQQKQRSGFVRHRLPLKSDRKKLGVLHFTGRAPLPNTKNKLPRFIGGDSIIGILELDLDTPTCVQNITLNVSVPLGLFPPCVVLTAVS
jgi:hypothetical protein